MKQYLLILLIAFSFNGMSQSSSLHKLIIKLQLPEGHKNQYWNQLIMESDDTSRCFTVETNYLSTTIDKIPQGKYHIKIKSIFGDIIDTSIIIKHKPLYRLTINKTREYYIPNNDSIIFTQSLNDIDSIYIVCKYMDRDSAEYIKLQLLNFSGRYFLRKYENILSDEYKESEIDKVLFNKFMWFEIVSSYRSNTDYGVFGFHTEHIFKTANKVTVYMLNDIWKEGYDFINELD